MIPMARQEGGGGYTRERYDRAAPRRNPQWVNEKFSPVVNNHIIILRARGRVGDIDVVELVLQPTICLIFVTVPKSTLSAILHYIR